MKHPTALLLLLLAFSLGALCEEEFDYNPCEEVTCSNRGQCVVEDGGPACHCETGYVSSGLSCVSETDIDASDGAVEDSDTPQSG